MNKNILATRKEILKWYHQNKRDLPWRQSNDPYFIWVSEIILQQTQVKTGLAYYERFIKKFPTVLDLSNADEDEVLKLWQGLGYYSRARNMHFAAKQITSDFGGVFPKTFEGILSLKGVGDYTAAAISSIAFGLPHAVVDGNVIRVISRLFGIKDPVDTSQCIKKIKSLSVELLDENNSGDFNQALMEFGALQCVPAKPACNVCPLQVNCVAFKNKIVHEIPLKSKKIKSRNRYFNYLILQDEDGIILQQRVGGDIWQGLYELPLIESEKQLNKRSFKSSLIKEFRLNKDIEFETEFVYGPVKHVLSHQVIHANFIRITPVEVFDSSKKEWINVAFKDLETYPIARLTELFFEAWLNRK